MKIVLTLPCQLQNTNDKDKLIKIVWNIAKKNITDINKLMRMIKNAIIP